MKTNKGCNKLHESDRRRVSNGSLEVRTVTSLVTGRKVTVLDFPERNRIPISGYEDLMPLLEERARQNCWPTDNSIISSLWTQIRSGETVLSKGGKSAHGISLKRDVDGVNVVVKHRTNYGEVLQLVEDSVKYDNEWEIRQRPYAYVSGKSPIGEFAHLTAARELGEELGIHLHPNQFLPKGLRIVTRNSPLFPGLPSTYYFRVFQCFITCPRMYNYNGYTTYQNGVKSRFIWIPEKEVETWYIQRLITKVKDQYFPDW
jgi:hypothetical protein